MRILFIRLSAIGDIFHGFAVARDIKENYPNCTLDWLVDSRFEYVAKMCEDVDNIISIPFKAWKRNITTLPSKYLDFRSSLKNKNYDLIIESHGLIKPAIFSKTLFKGDVYGLSTKSANDGIFASCFYKKKFIVNRDNIALIRFRELAAKALNYKVNYNLPKVKVKTNPSNLNLLNYVLFLHGTSKDEKKLSLDEWTQIAYLILEKTDLNIALSYSTSQEYNFCQNLISKVNNKRLILIEKQKFSSFADIVKNATMIVGVDTGFTHLANILNKKLIAIYNYSNPNHVGILETENSICLDLRENDNKINTIQKAITKLV